MDCSVRQQTRKTIWWLWQKQTNMQLYKTLLYTLEPHLTINPMWFSFPFSHILYSMSLPFFDTKRWLDGKFSWGPTEAICQRSTSQLRGHECRTQRTSQGQKDKRACWSHRVLIECASPQLEIQLTFGSRGGADREAQGGLAVGKGSSALNCSWYQCSCETTAASSAM